MKLTLMSVNRGGNHVNITVVCNQIKLEFKGRVWVANEAQKMANGKLQNKKKKMYAQINVNI